MTWQRVEFEKQKLLIAKGIINNMRSNYNKVMDFSEVEFSVFSQIGDDGIIQYLINQITLIIKDSKSYHINKIYNFNYHII